MDFQLVAAVLKAVFLSDDCPRKFARLADRHKAGASPIRHRSTENEPASFNTDHTVDLDALELFNHAVNGPSQCG